MLEEWLLPAVALDGLNSLKERIHRREAGVTSLSDLKIRFDDQPRDGKLNKEESHSDCERYKDHGPNLVLTEIYHIVEDSNHKH